MRTTDNLADTQQVITEVCNEIRDMLLAKNQKYGNSATNPVRIFSKASTEEQILVRLDDKLSRLAKGDLDDTEDVFMDLIGYLLLLRVHRRQEGRKSGPADGYLGKAFTPEVLPNQRLAEALAQAEKLEQTLKHIADFQSCVVPVVNEPSVKLDVAKTFLNKQVVRAS